MVTTNARLLLDLLQRGFFSLGGQGAVDLYSSSPPSRRPVHQILHQGDEWRDDDRGALEMQSRQLITERLPRSRGHDGERVLAFHYRPDHRGLPRPKLMEAEGASE